MVWNWVFHSEIVWIKQDLFLTLDDWNISDSFSKIRINFSGNKIIKKHQKWLEIVKASVVKKFSTILEMMCYFNSKLFLNEIIKNRSLCGLQQDEAYIFLENALILKNVNWYTCTSSSTWSISRVGSQYIKWTERP